MNIKFNKLVIDNFLSFGHAEIDLRDRGFTLVNGVNRNPDDGARSNGSGKSALWDAISWALTGTTIRGITKDIVNIHTTGGCKVELDFNIDRKNYVICRYKDHSEFGNNIKFYVDGKDESGKGIRDTEKIIQSFLPDINSSLIGSVIILGQGLPQRFSNNTPSGRKEVLETLSKSDFMIEDIKKRLANRKEELNKDLRDAQDSRLSVESKVKVLESQIEDNKVKLKEYETIQDESEKIKRLEATIEECTTALEASEKELEEKKAEYSGLSGILTQYHYEQEKEREEATKEYRDAQSALKEKQTALNFQLSQKKNELNSIESIRDVCPTCGQKLPEVYKPNPEPVRAAIQELTELLNQSVRDCSDIEHNIELIYEEVSTKYTKKSEEASKRSDELGNRIASLQGTITSLKSTIRFNESELNTIKTKQSTYEARKAELTIFIETATKQIEDLTSQNLYNIEKEESAKLHLEAVNKMITIATREFRGYLLTNVISFIDKKAKDYAKDIFGTDKISFSLDGNNINIMYDEKMYESLSGGEKQRVDIIVQFAIKDMLCQFSGFACNILVLDEILDSLDKVSSDSVIDFLLNNTLDIESVFFVTHRAELSIPAEGTIVVYKDINGISSLIKC